MKEKKNYETKTKPIMKRQYEKKTQKLRKRIRKTRQIKGKTR